MKNIKQKKRYKYKIVFYIRKQSIREAGFTGDFVNEKKKINFYMIRYTLGNPIKNIKTEILMETARYANRLFYRFYTSTI